MGGERDNDGLVDWGVGGGGGGGLGWGGGRFSTKIRPMLIGHEISPVNGT